MVKRNGESTVPRGAPILLIIRSDAELWPASKIIGDPGYEENIHLHALQLFNQKTWLGSIKGR